METRGHKGRVLGLSGATIGAFSILQWRHHQAGWRTNGQHWEVKGALEFTKKEMLSTLIFLEAVFVLKFSTNAHSPSGYIGGGGGCT